jgi:hypothetical protein
LRFSPALILVSLLAACGQQMPGQAVSAPSGASPAPTPRPDLPSDPDGEDGGKKLLERMRAKFRDASAVAADVRSYSEGYYRTGKRVSDLRKSTYRTRLIWQKPIKLRGDVVDTDNWLVSGAAMATTDGKSVRVRAQGVLGLFPITLEAGDALLSNNRNHRFVDLAPGPMIARVMGERATWRLLGDATLSGRSVKVVEVRDVARVDAGITREILSLDAADLTLWQVRMYEGARAVVDHTFFSFRWNPAVRPEQFKL